jgi:FlaA1/EpsC-like NDP-sugar epimerase
VLLVGTPETVRLLSNQMSLLPGAPIVGGCVLLEESNHRTIGAMPVLGFVRDLTLVARAAHASQGVTKAFITLPAARRAAEEGLVRAVRAAGLHPRVLVPLDEQITGAGSTVRPTSDAALDFSTLIGRTPYGIDRRAVSKFIAGRRVLVTGAGGSIGREICRIVSTFEPAQLILMERAENALFEVDQWLGRRTPGVVRKAVLHDVVDAEATLRHCVSLKPEVVFHAAAHKHVPLMEDHPAHAVLNNLFGTKSIADAAMAVGCTRFVMISSDKAVNPTSVMGATKRLAELYVQSLDRQARAQRSPSRFCMVRFGNVLGSACSVLPIWTGQMAEGGPITVTDARMTRYFMTIQEAASLVIQSGAIEPDAGLPGLGAKNATVYVLDMGEPVRILDLAQRFVRAHGYEPRLVEKGHQPPPAPGDGAIMDVVLTGARPGEKLHEELAYAAEQLRPTPFAGINAWAADQGRDFDAATVISDMTMAKQSHDKERVLELIRKHVPEMRGL